MKTRLLLCFLLLISLVLPVKGMAGAELAAQPCSLPMSDLDQAALHMDHAEHGQHDTQDHDGNPLCKSGHQCKVGCLLLVDIPQADAGVASPSLTTFHSEFIPARNCADVWRPPRA
ncbi:hypothetical protein CXK94_17345 [Stutzerimonas stutzeri]|uniref:CopL family metal-binding regulatory protein n=1 Tax=Stutzerimonas stutzeri TaxID=316 RepID=A0A2N8SXJ4_STUST|nr:hypothetical protein [Stutzerimonas stutzeri]MCQ4325611.1 hypothetical protein [Stutzerimonas stutzeri]PNG07195.1 hypothetical protein CXK94_17345 [Stutzerimonas stutzeri]